MIFLLRKKNNHHYTAQFIQIWNDDSFSSKPEDKAIEKKNDDIMNTMIKDLLTSFTPRQKKKLSSQLYSISRTFNEMANE
jgi:hypothetical protein